MRRYLTAVTTKTLKNDRSFRINVSTGASLCAAITSYNGTMLSRTFKTNADVKEYSSPSDKMKDSEINDTGVNVQKKGGGQFPFSGIPAPRTGSRTNGEILT